MKPVFFLKSVLPIVIIFVSLFVHACTGGRLDSTGAGPGPGTLGAAASTAGTWNIRDMGTGNSCAFQISAIDTYRVTITQSGGALLLTTPRGTFQGRLEGGIFSYSGSFRGSFSSHGRGTTTITYMGRTLRDYTLSGIAAWKWTDGVRNCAGSRSFSGSRA